MQAIFVAIYSNGVHDLFTTDDDVRHIETCIVSKMLFYLQSRSLFPAIATV